MNFPKKKETFACVCVYTYTCTYKYNEENVSLFYLTWFPPLPPFDFDSSVFRLFFYIFVAFLHAVSPVTSRNLPEVNSENYVKWDKYFWDVVRLQFKCPTDQLQWATYLQILLSKHLHICFFFISRLIGNINFTRATNIHTLPSSILVPFSHAHVHFRFDLYDFPPSFPAPFANDQLNYNFGPLQKLGRDHDVLPLK